MKAAEDFNMIAYGSVPEPGGPAAKLDESRVAVIVSLLILGMELCTTFASETFDGTQVFFIGNLKMHSDLNDGMKFARDRIYMVFLLVCAKLGDNGLGRFWTIVTGACVYFMGIVMVSLATHPWISRLVWYLLGAFLVLPFSQAAVQANIINFGADQYDTTTEGGRIRQEQFFWWFNVATHSGEALAYLLLACYGIAGTPSQYLIADGFERHRPATADSQEYYTVLISSAAAFVVAICFFGWGKSFYSQRSLAQLACSPIVGLTQYLVKMSSHLSFQGAALLSAKVVGITIYISQAALFWSPRLAAPLSIASAVGVVFSVGGILVFCQNVTWLDGVPKPEETPLAVEDLKDFLRLLPLIMCAQISYGSLVMMMRTWYHRQACQMDLRYVRGPELDPDPRQMFTSFFDIFYAGTIIVCTPLVLYHLNPRIDSFCRRFGWRFHDWSKFIVGLVFGVLSNLFAIYNETQRRAAPPLSGTSFCAPHGVGVRAYTAYWMLFPYMLMGFCTLYAVPALSTISYRLVPKTVRSLTVVTNIFMTSASQSLVMAISVGMREYTPHDLDKGHLEYLYFIIIAISGGLFVIFANMMPYFEEREYLDANEPDPTTA